jgi:hypothetical protein
MPDTVYAITGTAGTGVDVNYAMGTSSFQTQTTGYAEIRTWGSTSLLDLAYVNIAIFR